MSNDDFVYLLERERRDERIRTLREVLQITSDHGEPECHWEIVKLLEQAEAEQEAKP